MPSTNLSFRAPYPLLNQVQARDPKGLKNPGSVAKKDLERWYGALASAMRDVQISPAAAILLIRIVREVSAEGPPTESFVADLPRYVRNNPHEGFEHVRKDLALRLEIHDQITRWAMVDAAERYEVLRETQPEMTSGMALHQVGLHSYTATPEELASLERTKVGQPDGLDPIGPED